MMDTIERRIFDAINCLRFSQVIFRCCVICSLFVLSCSENKAPENLLPKTQQIINDAAPSRTVNAAASNSLGAMYWLYMKTSDFKALAAKRDRDKRKLVFQFCLTPKHPDSLTLRGWAGKGDDEYDNTKFILDILKPDKDIYNKEIYFSSQKIISDDVNALLKDIGGDDGKYVVFDPQPSPADYLIFYNIYLVTEAQLAEMKTSVQFLAPVPRIITNPSPPASSKNNDRN